MSPGLGLGLGLGLTPSKGVGLPALPAGYAFLIKADGTYWVAANGNYYIRKVA